MFEIAGGIILAIVLLYVLVTIGSFVLIAGAVVLEGREIAKQKREAERIARQQLLRDYKAKSKQSGEHGGGHYASNCGTY